QVGVARVRPGHRDRGGGGDGYRRGVHVVVGVEDVPGPDHLSDEDGQGRVEGEARQDDVAVHLPDGRVGGELRQEALPAALRPAGLVPRAGELVHQVLLVGGELGEDLDIAGADRVEVGRGAGDGHVAAVAVAAADGLEQLAEPPEETPGTAG